MAGEEPGRAVGLEPGHVAMPARVGVQRLFLRGEGVEQRETGLAVDVLVVALEQELDRDGDLCRRLGQGFMPETTEYRRGDPGFDRRQRYSCPRQPNTAAVILGSTAVNGTPIPVPCMMPQKPIGPSAPISGSSWRASRVACHSGTARAARSMWIPTTTGPSGSPAA